MTLHKERTMKLPLLLTCAGILGFIAAPARAQDSPESDVRAVVGALAAGIQAGDLASLDTLFAEGRGVHIIEGAGVNHGWVDYRDNHLAPELEHLREPGVPLPRHRAGRPR